MTECTADSSPRTNLATIGLYMREQGIWQAIEVTVGRMRTASTVIYRQHGRIEASFVIGLWAGKPPVK
jgi:hypothetical protein